MQAFPFDSEVTGIDQYGYPTFDRTYHSKDLQGVFQGIYEDGVTSGSFAPSINGEIVSLTGGAAILNGIIATSEGEEVEASSGYVVIRCDYDERAVTVAVKETEDLDRNDYVWELGICSIVDGEVIDTREDPDRCGVIQRAVIPATRENLGVVMIGDNIDVHNGKIGVPLATKETPGVAAVGDNLTVSDGVVSVPEATSEAFGVVKIGTEAGTVPDAKAVADSIAAEAAEREAADDLSNQRIETVEASLAAETEARADADNQINQRVAAAEDSIAAEAEAREAAENQINQRIGAAETSLAAETKARTDEDSKINQRIEAAEDSITSETEARKNADNALGESVTKALADAKAFATSEAEKATETAAADATAKADAAKTSAVSEANAYTDSEIKAKAYTLPTANGSTLGGVKLSESTTSSSGVSGGTAATPKAVADAMDKAVSALNAANEAAGAASTAQTTADAATEDAAAAQSTADAAAKAAATAQSTADTAKTDAAAAQSTADEAITNAAAAQSTADTAKDNAAAAQSTANAATSAAAAAQSTADGAQTAAEAAQATADANTGKITDEAAARKAGDESLTTSLAAETKARTDEDGALTVLVNAAQGTADDAMTETERNALEIIGTYASRDLSVVLADEIASGKTVYDALHARVQAGNYEGLRIGDYIDVALTDSTAVTASATQRFLIAHFDPYRWCGDTAKGRHIAFVAATSIAVSSTYPTVVNSSYVQWNTTATNQGSADDKHPYTISNLKAWETAFEACLPTALSNYLLTQRVLLEERYSASGSLADSNGWSWANIGKVWSLSETEVYGQCVWGTKGYSVGFDCQFDLFHDTAHRINNNRNTWWLRSARSGSASGVCNVSYSGGAVDYSAAYTWVRPRVGFLLG